MKIDIFMYISKYMREISNIISADTENMKSQFNCKRLNRQFCKFVLYC